ncbi:hypothetical protein AB0C96_09060 [Streptomyces sp. NPDC048506]|uniref:hypothetical protein n=1 Tax=Streptomyces sp. NPDC048506 TaxID=3155028 RepID=UPI00343BDE27
MTAADRYTAHVTQGSSHVHRQEANLVRPRLPIAEYFERVLEEFGCHFQLHRFGVVSQAGQKAAAALLGTQVAGPAVGA